MNETPYPCIGQATRRILAIREKRGVILPPDIRRIWRSIIKARYPGKADRSTPGFDGILDHAPTDEDDLSKRMFVTWDQLEAAIVANEIAYEWGVLEGLHEDRPTLEGRPRPQPELKFAAE